MEEAEEDRLRASARAAGRRPSRFAVTTQSGTTFIPDSDANTKTQEEKEQAGRIIDWTNQLSKSCTF
jgi:hypothetical protein